MSRFDGPNLGMIPDSWIYDIGDAGPLGDRHRIKISIDKTAEIPSSHFIARFKSWRAMRKNMKMIRTTTKWLRRFQAQKIVLDEIDSNSKMYGDMIRANSSSNASDIQSKIDNDNYYPKDGTVPYESVLVQNFGLLGPLKQRINRFNERRYINRFKAKAYLKYNKEIKRKDMLSKANHEIDYHKQLLHNHLFHNFNVSAINSGKIKKENNYYGILPDPADYEIVKKYIDNNQTNNNNINQNNINNTNVTNNNTNQNNINNTNVTNNNSNQNSTNDHLNNITKPKVHKVKATKVTNNINSIKNKNKSSSNSNNNNNLTKKEIELLEMLNDYDKSINNNLNNNHNKIK